MPELYKHVKTNHLYEMICSDAVDEPTIEPVVVYRALDTGVTWVRPHAEFFDGRFVLVETRSSPECDPMKDIIDFHEKFDLAYVGPPRVLTRELFEFRLGFMQEELDEWAKSTERGLSEVERSGSPDLFHYESQLEKQLDALVDLQYVLLGTAYLQGLSPVFPDAWASVHKANMAKVRAQSIQDSKRGSLFDVVKPVGWEPPDHLDLVRINDLSGSNSE